MRKYKQRLNKCDNLTEYLPLFYRLYEFVHKLRIIKLPVFMLNVRAFSGMSQKPICRRALTAYECVCILAPSAIYCRFFHAIQDLRQPDFAIKVFAFKFSFFS